MRDSIRMDAMATSIRPQVLPRRVRKRKDERARERDAPRPSASDLWGWDTLAIQLTPMQASNSHGPVPESYLLRALSSGVHAEAVYPRSPTHRHRDAICVSSAPRAHLCDSGYCDGGGPDLRRLAAWRSSPARREATRREGRRSGCTCPGTPPPEVGRRSEGHEPKRRPDLRNARAVHKRMRADAATTETEGPRRTLALRRPKS